MDMRSIVTAAVFAYVTSFVMYLNAAVVDISVHVGTSRALNYTTLSPQGIFVRVTRLRRIGMLPGSLLAALYFATASPQFRRKRTRLMFQGTALAAFGFGTHLRKFDVDDRGGGDDAVDDAYEGPRWDVYRSRGFLKGLLLASVPLSLSEHFNDAWTWTKEAIFERVELDKSTFATTVLWKHLAWGGIGVFGYAYRLFNQKRNAKEGLAGLKREMSWLALASPAVIAACIMYSRENIDHTVNWFVIIDTTLTEPFVTPAACLTPQCFPGETKAVGLCLAKAIRYAWKFVAEPLVVASLHVLGIQPFFVTVLALRMVCSIVIFFSKPKSNPSVADNKVIASAAAQSAEDERLYEHLRDLSTGPESGEQGYEYLRDMTSALTDCELQRLRELSSLSCGVQHTRAHEYLHLRDMGSYYSID